jgi:photosystem II stability/assembly factor-like uncharacterized protein
MIFMARKFLPLLFILALLTAIIPFHNPVSAAEAMQWTAANIPAEGITGKWALAGGSDIRNLTVAPDGTLYCSANPSGTVYTLFKSTDNGRGWTTTGKVTDIIVDIAILPQDSMIVYYATAARIYKSVDAGNTFIQVPVSPGGAGSGNVCITSIDVVRAGNTNTIAVSTVDTDTAQYGGVYLLEENQFACEWKNTNIGNYDAYRIVFSPDYFNDRQIVALASNEADTFISSRLNGGNWGQFISIARIPGIIPTNANICFPDGYNCMTDNAFFAAIDTGISKGGVFKITSGFAPALSTVKDLKIGAVDGQSTVDVSGLVCSGSAILAGCARQARVYLSNDSGASWIQSLKQPSGQSDTSIVKTPNSPQGQNRFYTATCGADSAFSCSNDSGRTWDQLSLIDTKISEIFDIITPAPSIVCILTLNSQTQKHSLWRTLDNGRSWDRIFCTGTAAADSFKLVRSGPQYGAAPPTIIVTGLKGNVPAIWTSNDYGQTFVWHPCPYNIDTMAIIDAGNWFISTSDSSKNLIYSTHNGGYLYSAPVEAGNITLNALIASPDYQNDKIILAGTNAGQVFLSQDNGLSFTMIGQQLPLTSALGKISLAFDNKFSENKIIYASTDAKSVVGSKERIFRFTVGQSSAWLSIYASLPDNSIIKQLICGNDGTLYAVNSMPVVNADLKGGVVRTLNPTTSSPAFETILPGLDDTVTLTKISSSANQLWAIDSKNTRVLTFIDSLAAPVVLISPDDKAAGLETTALNLKWQACSDATMYEWQISDNTGFTGIPASQTGTSDVSSARLTGLNPAAVYYWRVRVSKPFLSRWSDTWSFNTILGGTNVAPAIAVPAAGAKTPLRPLFQWSIIASADKYDLLVAGDTSFAHPVIDKTGDNAVSCNAWESDIILENDTTYYWKVKARNASNVGAWSPVSAFITEPRMVTPTTPENARAMTIQQTTKDPLPQQTQIVSTVILQQQPAASPPQAITINFNIPPWLMFSGLLLLTAVVIILALLVVTATRQKR